MANIQPYIDQIQNAVYGEEVRSSIINALEAVNDDNESYQEIKEAVVDAKDTVEEVAENISDQISTADGLATTLEGDISVGQQVKSELEDTTTTAQQTKGGLDSSITSATALKTDLTDLVTAGSSIRSDVEASAQTATQKASEASQSAGTAVQAKDETVTAKNTAVEASQTAVTKAGEASTSATTATQKATEANQSAQTAVQAKDTAVSKANEAGQSAQSASQSAQTATQKAQEAVESAQSVSASAQQIQTNKNDISTIKADFLQSLIYDTASGSAATFPDGAHDLPCKSVVAQIVPVQSGSGDPSPDNVRPISGWDAVNVVRCGKNLWGGSAFLKLADNWTNAVVDTDAMTLTGKVSNLQTRANVFEFPFKQNTKYTIFIQTSVANTGLYVVYTDGTEASITTTRFVSNPNKTLDYLRFYISTSETITFYANSIGVFEGEVSADDFEPYTGSTYSANLPQTVYGGTLDVVSGTLTIDRCYVDDITWTQYAQSNGYTAYRSQSGLPTAKYNNDAANLPISNSVGVFGSFSSASMTKTIMQPPRNNTSIAYLAYPDGADPAGVTVSYLIKDPITIQLTPQEVATLLGSNTVYADSGDVAVEYPADTKLYISRLTEPDSEDMIADANIVSGKYFMVGNDLYLATANIANGGAITPGTNCTKVSLATALNAINS